MGSIRRLRDSFQVDFYLGEYRFRKNLSSEVEARHLLKIVEAKILGKEAVLSDAVALYIKSVSAQKSDKSKNIDVYILKRLESYMLTRGEEESSFVSAVKPHHVERLRTWLVDDGLAASSINRYFNTLKHFFRKCEEWGFIQKSPARFIRALSTNPVVRRPWTCDEVQVVRKSLSEKDLAVFDLLMLTGARLSQILSLKVSDVDVENKVVHLKSKKGPRSQEKIYQVPITQVVVNIFVKIINSKKPNDYIFVSDNGSPINPMLYSKNFKRLLKRKKLIANHLTLHGLRHTFASKLSKAGVPINDIKLLLGHSTTKITETYIHSSVEDLRKHLK